MNLSMLISRSFVAGAEGILDQKEEIVSNLIKSITKNMELTSMLTPYLEEAYVYGYEAGLDTDAKIISSIQNRIKEDMGLLRYFVNPKSLIKKLPPEVAKIISDFRAFLCGGSVLKCIFDADWDSDYDLYLHISDYDEIRKSGILKSTSVISPNNPYNGNNHVLNFKEEYGDIQFIINTNPRKNFSIMDIISKFDIDICSIALSGSKPYLFVRQGSIKAICDKSVYTQSVSLSPNRLQKYVDRGFKFSGNLDNVPYVSDTDNMNYSDLVKNNSYVSTGYDAVYGDIIQSSDIYGNSGFDKYAAVHCPEPIKYKQCIDKDVMNKTFQLNHIDMSYKGVLNMPKEKVLQVKKDKDQEGKFLKAMQCKDQIKEKLLKAMEDKDQIKEKLLKAMGDKDQIKEKLLKAMEDKDQAKQAKETASYKVWRVDSVPGWMQKKD